MTVPTFSPPLNPSFRSTMRQELRTVNLSIHAGYEERRPLTIRPLRRGDLTWAAATLETKRYIESFFDGLEGTGGPFLWTPYDRIASPTGITPEISEVSGGSLGSRTYYVVFTWYDSTYGETLESARASSAIQANYYAVVTIPCPKPLDVASWRVYVSETSGSEKLEDTISSGRVWTQSGTLSGSADPPSSNTLSLPGKWILLDQVQYLKASANRWQITMTILEQMP